VRSKTVAEVVDATKQAVEAVGVVEVVGAAEVVAVAEDCEFAVEIDQ
jgi:hypothetical protein